MFQFKNKSIIILSPEDWGKSQLSKHLYAKELSKNNTIYFLHTIPHTHQPHFIETQIVEQNITLIHLKNVVRGINKLPPFLIDIQNKQIIKKLLKIIDKRIDVVWSFDQSKFQNLRQFNASIKIFHPVDYIETASPYLTRIANSADVVLSVSHAILDEIDTTTPKHFINHGLDNIFVQKNDIEKRPDFIPENKINVGYVGNLQIKLMDWEALTNTIKLNPDVNFVFIGPDKNSNIGGSKTFEQLDVIKSLKNTYFTGTMTKEELQRTLCFFDAFLISYDHKKFPIQVSNSHKILEYLSTGKVIISNCISTYNDSDLIEFVSDNNLLPNKLTAVIKNLTKFNHQEKIEARIKFAKDNLYPKQIARIETLLNL